MYASDSDTTRDEMVQGVIADIAKGHHIAILGRNKRVEKLGSDTENRAVFVRAPGGLKRLSWGKWRATIAHTRCE